jgi:hypothetical protein
MVSIWFNWYVFNLCFDNVTCSGVYLDNYSDVCFYTCMKQTS